MIYLIDDKKERQNSLCPVSLNNKESIKTIYNWKELEPLRLEIFSNKDNIILFHDSFFDNPLNKHEKSATRIRQDIVNKAKNKDIKAVLFTGGIDHKTIESDNLVFLPVGVLYRNIGLFIKKYNENVINLRYLAFGKNYKIESVFSYRDQLVQELFEIKLSEYLTTENSIYLTYLEELLKTIDQMNLYESFENKILENKLDKESFLLKINNLIKQYLNE